MAKVGLPKKQESGEVAKPIYEQVPDWMRQEQALGIEDLSQYIVPPRMKVVQKTSLPPFDELFAPGEVCVVPQMVRVAGMQEAKVGQPFYFVPLLFFPEWLLTNPIELKGSVPFIRARTADPNSPMCAKSRNPALWSERCPENPEYDMRYVECLNFVILLHGDHELAGVPVCMSFAKAEHRSGSNFAALIKMRRAPIYGCQFMGVVGSRQNAKGAWFGIDIVNPDGESGVTPFVQEQDRFGRYKEMHLELKKAHEESKIRVDYEDTPATDAGDTVVPEGDKEY